MKFRLDIIPPTTTHQQKKVTFRNNRTFVYEPAKLKEARTLLTDALSFFVPLEMLTGALQLNVTWYFPQGRSHKTNEWRITRPDTDNLQKLLKDCMTACGYWKDDSLVVREIVEKVWSDTPGIEIEILELDKFRCNNK